MINLIPESEINFQVKAKIAEFRERWDKFFPDRIEEIVLITDLLCSMSLEAQCAFLALNFCLEEPQFEVIFRDRESIVIRKEDASLKLFRTYLVGRDSHRWTEIDFSQLQELILGTIDD